MTEPAGLPSPPSKVAAARSLGLAIDGLLARWAKVAQDHPEAALEIGPIVEEVREALGTIDLEAFLDGLAGEVRDYAVNARTPISTGDDPSITA